MTASPAADVLSAIVAVARAPIPSTTRAVSSRTAITVAASSTNTSPARAIPTSVAHRAANVTKLAKPIRPISRTVPGARAAGWISGLGQKRLSGGALLRFCGTRSDSTVAITLRPLASSQTTSKEYRLMSHSASTGPRAKPT